MLAAAGSRDAGDGLVHRLQDGADNDRSDLPCLKAAGLGLIQVNAALHRRGS